jgi:uncharacterized FAD-dependent dehydrogenase
MGNRVLEFKCGSDISDDQLRKKIKQKLKLSNFTFQIVKKSIDARRKGNIFWNLRVAVESSKIKGEDVKKVPQLKIPTISRKRTVTIIGLGPAGFFSAYTLAKAGFDVRVIEQGSGVEKRSRDIALFEKERVLDEQSNYSFGEGGAGTYSDGKLTSRTKRINLERDFIYKTYVEAGAPDEILYMTHPHLGTDNLKKIVKRLREMLLGCGGNIHFDEKLIDIDLCNNKINSITTDRGEYSSDYYIFATGHSSTDTYLTLIDRGIPFRVKPFAVGMRAEHRREVINRAQWGVDQLEGFKSAEYRLTHKVSGGSTYSFCMCPGGKIVPVTPYKDCNIVNGMSNFMRNSPHSNAAIVTTIDLRESEYNTPKSAVEWLRRLEDKFFKFTNGYDVPAITIEDFLSDRVSSKFPESSFPFSLVPFNPYDLFPTYIVENLKEGLHSFNRKLEGYRGGTLIGLESKTSSPLQVARDEDLFVETIDNMIYCGEGSGYSGGIVSSAADGIKGAFSIIKREIV